MVDFSYTLEQKNALYHLSVDCINRGGSIGEYITVEEMQEINKLGLYLKWEEGCFAGIRPEKVS